MHAYRSEKHCFISLNTCGIIFLGTPFRGSGSSAWRATIAKSAALLGFGSDYRLLEMLERGSERLDLLLNDFTVMAKLVGMELLCFYETKMGSFGVGIKTLVSCVQPSTFDFC